MKVKLGRICLFAAIAVVFNSGCAVFDAIVGQSGERVDPEVVATWWDGPRIRPGVALIVQLGAVAGSQPVTMEVQVDRSGYATIPYLLTKPVMCDGLTLEAFQSKVTCAYQEFIKQPQVTVRFAQFDQRTGVSPYGTVQVLGEVANPGPVNMPPTMDLTVLKAIQTAGGLRPFADKTKIQVTRCEKDGRQCKTIVDLDEIGKQGRIDKDMLLKPGDVVYAYETWL